MAGTVTLKVLATILNGSHSEVFGSSNNITIVQDAIGAHAPVVTVGFAAEEDMPIGDVSVLGWLFLKNLDSTNFVTYGPKDTTMKAFGRIEPGEYAALRLEPGITLRWQADTADVQVKVLLLED